MARLTNLKPRLGSLPSRFASSCEDSRPSRHMPSRRWLKSAEWLTTRQRILLRDLYTCQMCGRLVAGKGEAHIDHKHPHNENKAAFFCDDAGLQVLCVNCHVKVKQSAERRAGLIR